jgi:dTDP-4-dehydrorhamnose 3,5-epimerase-like enzyme
MVENCHVIELKKFYDERGFFTELHNQDRSKQI